MGSWGIWNQCKIDCWPGNDFEKWLAWCDDSIMMMIMKMRWCQTTSRKLGGECISWKTVYGKKHISYWSFKNKPSQPHGIFATGGGGGGSKFTPIKKKNKNKNKPSQPHGIFAAGGGQNAHTRKKKQTFPSECRKILFKSECFGKVVLNSITVESFQVPTSDIILT